MKHLFLLLALTFGLGLSAKTDKQAKALLDRTAKAIETAGGIKAEFRASAFEDKQMQNEIQGTLYMKGRALCLTSDDVTYWYDGTTLWSYIHANQEVNVSTPQAHEQQTMNPYAFVTLYKKGYDIEFCPDETIRGKKCKLVRLLAQNKSAKIQEMLLHIDPSTAHPACIRMRVGAKKWTRINITRCLTGQKFPDSTFKYNPSDHPDVEVIDLR